MTENASMNLGREVGEIDEHCTRIVTRVFSPDEAAIPPGGVATRMPGRGGEARSRRRGEAEAAAARRGAEAWRGGGGQA